jgi:hypothetical protein
MSYRQIPKVNWSSEAVQPHRVKDFFPVISKMKKQLRSLGRMDGFTRVTQSFKTRKVSFIF